MRRKALVVATATALCFTGVMTGPAAAEAGGGTFECIGEFPLWPSAGSGVCEGTARGIFREGPTTVVCVPFCHFEMGINFSLTVCPIPDAGVPPLLAFFTGGIVITGGGTFDTPYTGQVVGTTLSLTTSSPVGAGAGGFVLKLPHFTCEVPGPQGFEMAGALAFD